MTTLSVQQLQDLAHKLRIHSIEATNASKSGHPTSCSSIAELMSVLFFHEMRYTLSNPLHECSDRFVLSKGHAAPILYAAWAEAGLFPKSELLNLRKIDSDLEGHPTPRLSFIDVGTGSLGQGLSVACGLAYVGKYFDKASYRVYVLLGDGESAEGSIWEALNFASHYALDNLVVIFDINRLGQSEATCLGHDMEKYKNRLLSFGFNAQVIDGHNINEIIESLKSAKTTKGKPTAIIAKTYKGKYFVGIEDQLNWHGKPLGDKAPEVIKHLKSMIKNETINFTSGPMIMDALPVDIKNITLSEIPSYRKGDSVATRLAYGVAISKLATTNERVIALDADTKNSTYSEKIKNVNKAQFIECYIAEQNLVGVAMGTTCRNRTVAFVSTFATFFTRAFDQIRMGAISQTNVNFVGSHCGVSIGEDGPSQMGLEDLALFRSIPGSTVFYPSDAVSCERAIEFAANTKGICYIRTSRPNTSMIYENNHTFKIGKAEVLRSSSSDVALVVGAGITLHEALKAADILGNSNINIRVMDPFTIKPLDADGLIKNAGECHNRIIVVEDHYPQGGIGEAVAMAVAHLGQIKVISLAVKEVPRSGPPSVLLDKYGINSQHIIETVKSIK